MTPENNEKIMKKGTGTNTNNNQKQPGEDFVFRRKEDQIKYDTTNKIVSIVKWLIALNFLLLYFFYSVTKDNKILVEYQMRMIGDISKKIERSQFLQIQSPPGAPASQGMIKTESKEYKSVFDTSVNAGKCMACHDSSQNPIALEPMWDYGDFRKYVRGEIRIPTNTIMPKYSENDISNGELEKMYFELKE